MKLQSCKNNAGQDQQQEPKQNIKKDTFPKIKMDHFNIISNQKKLKLLSSELLLPAVISFPLSKHPKKHNQNCNFIFCLMEVWL